MEKRTLVRVRTKISIAGSNLTVGSSVVHSEGIITTAQAEGAALKDSSSFMLEKRSGQERRKEPSCGFARISVVGWICRREQTRRKEDTGCLTTGKQ